MAPQNYVVSKGGVIGLTMVLAAQHAAGNVRVSCVAPGIFRTPMASAYTDEQWASLQPTIPMGRVGEPPKVANVIVSLLSDEWSFVTGQCINVNGASSCSRGGVLPSCPPLRSRVLIRNSRVHPCHGLPGPSTSPTHRPAARPM
jgi:Enoyl-(Acyl carrier protein) reductase